MAREKRDGHEAKDATPTGKDAGDAKDAKDAKDVARGCVVLTGATGFLGRELLWKLIAGLPPDKDIVCIIRADPRSSLGAGGEVTPQARAERRLHALLAEAPLDLDLHRGMPNVTGGQQRIFAQHGDISQPRLGLSEEAFSALAARTSEIYHGAATVRFDLPIAEARRTNVDGTRVMLDLATAAHAQGGLRRFHYIGTAFVAGNRRGTIREDELQLPGEVGLSFNNTYEETKCEAEGLVRERMQKGLPVTIYRPSIIVGDSKSGYTSSFKVMYWPLKVFARGLIPIVPAARASIVDLVPVDFVIDAIWALSQRDDTLGRCYHLAAGPEHSTTIGVSMDFAADFFRVYKPLFMPRATYERYIRPILAMVMVGKRRQALEAGRVYVPYLNYQASFDTSNARRDLRDSGLTVPDVRGYFETLLRYCVESNWGRKRPS
jgi:thioester reductase-like protein